MLDRIHAFAESLGLSPKVFDPFVIGLVAIAAVWIATGEFNEDELRLLGANLLYALVGITAPPARTFRQRDLIKGKKQGLNEPPIRTSNEPREPRR